MASQDPSDALDRRIRSWPVALHSRCREIVARPVVHSLLTNRPGFHRAFGAQPPALTLFAAAARGVHIRWPTGCGAAASVQRVEDGGGHEHSGRGNGDGVRQPGPDDSDDTRRDEQWRCTTRDQRGDGKNPKTSA